MTAARSMRMRDGPSHFDVEQCRMGLALGGAAVDGDLVEPTLLAGYHLDVASSAFESLP